MYRSARLEGNADLLSRLVLPDTDGETNIDLRLTNNADIDVYFIGASEVQPRLKRRTRSVLDELKQADGIFAEGVWSTVPHTATNGRASEAATVVSDAI